MPVLYTRFSAWCYSSGYQMLLAAARRSPTKRSYFQLIFLPFLRLPSLPYSPAQRSSHILEIPLPFHPLPDPLKLSCLQSPRSVVNNGIDVSLSLAKIPCLVTLVSECCRSRSNTFSSTSPQIPPNSQAFLPTSYPAITSTATNPVLPKSI